MLYEPDNVQGRRQHRNPNSRQRPQIEPGSPPLLYISYKRQNRNLGKSAQAMDQLDTIYIWKT